MLNKACTACPEQPFAVPAAKVHQTQAYANIFFAITPRVLPDAVSPCLYRPVCRNSYELKKERVPGFCAGTLSNMYIERIFLLFDSCLCGCNSCNGYAERAAAHVVHAY